MARFSPQHALALFVFLLLLGLVLVLQTNMLTISLSLGGLLLATIYPLKELHICHKWAWGGLGLGRAHGICC